MVPTHSRWLQLIPGGSSSFLVLVCMHFLSFCPTNNPQYQNLEMKKMPGDIILLHMCTINEDHMMYDSWNTRHNRQNFLSFWAIFCPFTLLTTGKIKISKKWKKVLCTINDDHMMYDSWDMEHNSFCNLESFFALLPH